jgi:hypothetical protein
MLRGRRDLPLGVGGADGEMLDDTHSLMPFRP